MRAGKYHFDGRDEGHFDVNPPLAHIRLQLGDLDFQPPLVKRKFQGTSRESSGEKAVGIYGGLVVTGSIYVLPKPQRYPIGKRIGK
jgi:hypothetical protein